MSWVIEFIADCLISWFGPDLFSPAIERNIRRGQKRLTQQRVPRGGSFRSSIRLLEGSHPRLHRMWMPGRVTVSPSIINFDSLFDLHVEHVADSSRWFSEEAGDEPTAVSPGSVIHVVEVEGATFEWAIPPEFRDWAVAQARGGLPGHGEHWAV